MITQTYHPLAKMAKDIAAGAVLLTAINAATVGMILFIKYAQLGPLHVSVSRRVGFPALIIVVVLVVVVTMVAKVLGERGSFLRGGIASGHAAIACVLAIGIASRAGKDGVTVLLAVILALLVAQSRIEGKIHTVREVVIGSLLGICITAGVYFFRIGGH
jgi:diacylglycerol kinase (ATP)